ncbi:hypothetical protein [Ramlibacter tataouinensis]|uniref:Lipoprotein n=1 Tax=Ramlibacter tataouinensis (strain ATCC BAA-407 / DSM 14655 / LMG 21543 / TTB310) TaxID=365046 RepID=F5Y4P7_RAMTT|nr:hypothetical protein [Ramlibacter tataouinensis]AEG91365.1 Hypothetical protein Rta_02950 [Ramlibacter tataouinensis TTB310]
MRFIRTAAALLPAFFLLACGGGGGGGDGGGTNSPTAAAVTITESNAMAVSAEAVGSVSNTESAQAGAGLAAGVQVDPASGGGNGATRKLAQSLRAVASLARPTAGVATGVAVDQTEACPAGGTLRTSGSISNPEAGFTAGDSISTVADNCRFDDGAGGIAMTINGSFSLTVHSGTLGGMPPFNVSFSISMRNYSVSDGTETIVFNGDSRFDWVANSDTDQTITVSGSAFASAAGDRPVVWKNYRQTLVVNGLAASSDLDATVETTNPRVGAGTVSYVITTTTPLAMDGSGRITAGRITVTGANNSAVVLAVTAPDTFSVQIDTNGDGGYEKTQTVTLAELQAQL